MSQKTTKAKTKKLTLTQSSLGCCIADLFLIISSIMHIVERQKPTDVQFYQSTGFWFKMLFYCVFILLYCISIIYGIYLLYSTEKEDELSKLHRYKAGRISKFITILLFAVVLYIIKDFSFAYNDRGFLDNLFIPIIMITTDTFIENVIFIILEKFQID